MSQSDGPVSGPPHLTTGLADSSHTEAKNDGSHKDASSPDSAGRRTPESMESFSSHTHEYLAKSVEFGEQKAAFVFAVDTAFLGYLFSLGVVEPLFTAHRWSAQTCLGVSSIALLLVSVAIAVAAVLPRLAGNPAGLIYFGNIASRSRDAYVNDVIRCSPNELVKATLEHCYELATIARSKHHKVRLSAWFGILGFVSGLAYAVLANRHAHFA